MLTNRNRQTINIFSFVFQTWNDMYISTRNRRLRNVCAWFGCIGIRQTHTILELPYGTVRTGTVPKTSISFKTVYSLVISIYTVMVLVRVLVLYGEVGTLKKLAFRTVDFFVQSSFFLYFLFCRTIWVEYPTYVRTYVRTYNFFKN